MRDLKEIITQVFEEMHDEKKPSKEYVFLLLVRTITLKQLVEQTSYFSSGPIS